MSSVYIVNHFNQVRKIRCKPLKAEDLEPDNQWARDLGSRSSWGSRQAAGGDSNDLENVKVKQEIDDDDDAATATATATAPAAAAAAMEIQEVPGEYSFVKLFVVQEV
jgi:hypothetical protein